MGRGNPDVAYGAACKEAYHIAQRCIDGVLQGIRDGEVTEDTLSDRIHEEVDDALIYTSDQWLCVYGLPENGGDAIEEGMCEPTDFNAVLAAQAFCNLRAAVNEHDFSDAFAVAEDAALEVTP